MLGKAVQQTVRRNWKSVKKLLRSPDLALNHFDNLYARVYGRMWPSIRLGLLSPKKFCAITNSFVHKTDDLTKEDELVIDLARYYKKHQQSYTRWTLRQQLIANKKARRRELIANNAQVSVESIDPDSIEVSDISDSELQSVQTSASEGFSTAEDLAEMFSDRRLDEDDKYFINQASTKLSLNEFVPATELIQHEDIPNDLKYYEGYDPDFELPIEFIDELELDFPEELKIHTHPRNSWSEFESPTSSPVVGLLNFYLMDGASILPVLALDIQFNDICADYCAAPGGKSLAMLMTMRPSYLMSNDVSTSRLDKMARIMKQYLPDISYVRSTLSMCHYNATSLVQPDTYDKILVDAPCSNDRVSVEALDNNIFKRTRTDERLQLPSKQAEILKAALKSVKPKGVVVYSTCTLSPIENDAVVQKALAQLLEEDHTSKFAVVNMKEAFRPLRGLYKFNTKFKYGQQILPSISSNFGPMYISKIKRLS